MRWATVEVNPFVSRRSVGAEAFQSSWAKRTLVPQDLGDGVTAVDGLVAATTSHLVMRLRLDAAAEHLRELISGVGGGKHRVRW